MQDAIKEELSRGGRRADRGVETDTLVLLMREDERGEKQSLAKQRNVFFDKMYEPALP